MKTYVHSVIIGAINSPPPPPRKKSIFMQGLFFYSADGDIQLNNTQNAFAAFPLQHWLRERTAIRYTHFAYLVFV